VWHGHNSFDLDQHARRFIGNADRRVPALEFGRATIGEARQKEVKVTLRQPFFSKKKMLSADSTHSEEGDGCQNLS